MLVVLGTSFGINFLYVSHFPENSYLATRIMRQHLFYNFRPPILASKANQQIMFFPTRFLDLICLFDFFQKLSIVGPPFKIQWALKWDPKSIIFAENSKSSKSFCGGGGFDSRSVFPETIVITVPFGPSAFLKIIFRCRLAHCLFIVYKNCLSLFFIIPQ